MAICIMILLLVQEAAGGDVLHGVPPDGTAPQSVTPDEFQTLKEEVAALRAEVEARSEEEGEAYRGAPLYGFGAVMNPDLSVVANLGVTLTNDRDDPARNRVRIDEVELAYQGYVYPGIRTDVIAAFDMSYGREDGRTTVEAEVHLEEAYLTAATLPWELDRYLVLQLGRKLLDFGRLNAVHPHHRPFPDNPLPLENFLGGHNWNDDGAQIDVLLPNPFEEYDLFVKWSSGLWNGKTLHGHGHEDAGGSPGYGEHLIPWKGLVFQQRLYGDFPLTEDMDVSAGGSYFWNEGNSVNLYGADVGYHYQWPGSYLRTTVAGEILWSWIRQYSTTGMGYFVYLDQSVTKNLSAGARYDWSEYPDNDSVDAWLITPYVTYYLNESTYFRTSYRYRELPGGDDDHAVFLQVVWGLGPHSHRLNE